MFSLPHMKQHLESSHQIQKQKRDLGKHHLDVCCAERAGFADSGFFFCICRIPQSRHYSSDGTSGYVKPFTRQETLSENGDMYYYASLTEKKM